MSRYRVAYLAYCIKCNFVFSVRIPSNSEILRNYVNYSRNKPLNSVTELRYRKLASDFKRYQNTKNWLDVGTGDGHMLSIALQQGWNVYGTELTDDAVIGCRSKGIMIHQGDLDTVPFEDGTFDIISFIEVLEHLNDPHRWISESCRLLRTGGLIYITTPNFNSLSRFLLKEYWSVIQYPEHLCYYTQKTLHNLLNEHGFKKKRFQTTGFSFSRFGHNSPTLLEYSIDDKVRSIAEKNLIVQYAKQLANTALNITHLGDTLKAWYINTSNKMKY